MNFSFEHHALSVHFNTMICYPEDIKHGIFLYIHVCNSLFSSTSFLNNSFDNSIASSVKSYLCLGPLRRNHPGFYQVQFSLNKQAPWCSRGYSTGCICSHHPLCLLPSLGKRTQTFVWTYESKQQDISYLPPTLLRAKVNVITFLHLL